MKRTFPDIKCYHSNKTYSCCKHPLFNIELDHIVLDELHLMLRITDTQLENLVMEVMDHDSHNDVTKSNREPKGFFLHKLVKCINDLGIPFPI